MRLAGPVLAAPSASAAATGSLKAGAAVTVLQRQGFWVRIQGSSATGWTKMSAVSLAGSTTGRDVAALATGRTGSGNVVSASGGRGLDNGEDLATATPAPAAVTGLARYAATQAAAEAFARAGHLQSRTLAYPPAPAAEPKAQP
jgi:Bacterial SH3 domain